MTQDAREADASAKLNIGAVRWSGIASLVRSFVALLQLFLLIRILGPESYGTVALTGLVVGYVLLLGDLGVNAALIQRTHVDESFRSANFWVGLFTNTVLAAMLWALSHPIGEFFRDGDLAEPVMLVAIAFWVSSLGAQHKAWAEKNFLFGRILIIEASAAVVGASVAISTALAGFGAMSFAFGMLASSGLSSCLAWTIVSPGWRPGGRFPLAYIKDSLTFGGKLVSLRSLSHLIVSADSLYAGRFLAATELGLYMGVRNIVLQAQSMVNPAITRVGFPAVAAVKYDRGKIKAVYLQSLNFAASLNAPVVAFFFFFGQAFGATLLGPQWEGTGEIFKIMALWLAVSSTLNIGAILVMGSGQLLRAILWALLRLTLLGGAFFWSGVSTSTGIATLMTVMAALFIVPAWLIIARPIAGVTFAEFVTTSLRPFILGAASFFVVSILPPVAADGIVVLFAKAFIAVFSYLLLSYQFNGAFLLDLRNLLSRGGKS